MTIRDEEEGADGAWARMGSGTLYRVLPGKPALDAQFEAAKVQKGGILTSDSLKSGPPTSACASCGQAILPGTYPTASRVRIGALDCQECSEAAGKPSLASKGTRSRGRPKKHQAEGS